MTSVMFELELDDLEDTTVAEALYEVGRGATLIREAQRQHALSSDELEKASLLAIVNESKEERLIAIDAIAHHLATAQATRRLSGSLDRWLSFVLTRMVPRRVQTEVLGDGIERISSVVRASGSRWAIRLVYATVVLTVLAETIRYWARAIKGGKALR